MDSWLSVAPCPDNNIRELTLCHTLCWNEMAEWLLNSPNLVTAIVNVFGKVTLIPRTGHRPIIESHIRDLCIVMNEPTLAEYAGLHLMDRLTLPSLKNLHLALPSVTRLQLGVFGPLLSQIGFLILQGAKNLTEVDLTNFGSYPTEQVCAFLEEVPQIKTLFLQDQPGGLFEILDRLKVRPFYDRSRGAVYCPNLEQFKISSCCWPLILTESLTGMFASRRGIYRTYRSKGSKRGAVKRIKVFLLDSSITPLKSVLVQTVHRGSCCRICHAVGHDRDYPNSHFDMGVFDDDLVAQTCILGGLTVSDTLSISIAYYQRSLIHCMN